MLKLCALYFTKWPLCQNNVLDTVGVTLLRHLKTWISPIPFLMKYFHIPQEFRFSLVPRHQCYRSESEYELTTETTAQNPASCIFKSRDGRLWPGGTDFVTLLSLLRVHLVFPEVSLNFATFGWRWFFLKVRSVAYQPIKISETVSLFWPSTILWAILWNHLL